MADQTNDAGKEAFFDESGIEKAEGDGTLCFWAVMQ